MTATALKPINALTVKETAFVLGVSPQTVYGWVYDKKIPYFRIFGAIRIKQATIDYLKECVLCNKNAIF